MERVLFAHFGMDRRSLLTAFGASTPGRGMNESGRLYIHIHELAPWVGLESVLNKKFV